MKGGAPKSRPGAAFRGAPVYIPRAMSENETPAPERRSNLVLRALIDEMLDQVRELNRTTGGQDAEDRAKAEAQLDSIMARVRRVAARKHAEPDGSALETT